MKFYDILHKHNVTPKDLYFNSRGYVNGIIESACAIRDYIPSGCVLDLGCGSGILSYMLKKMGFNIHGIDTYNHNETIDIFNDNIYLQMAIWKDIDEKLSFYDGERIPYNDNFFDAIIVHAVYEHISNIETILRETYRVLKPGGFMFIFRTPHKNAWQEKITRAHNNLIDEDVLYRQLKAAGFTIKENDKTDFMFWALPGLMQNVWNFLFPLLNKIDKFILKTYFKKYAHNLKVVAKKCVG